MLENFGSLRGAVKKVTFLVDMSAKGGGGGTFSAKKMQVFGGGEKIFGIF